MTLQLRRIKKCQWNRGWYVQLTEWIKPITVSKLKCKWMCFPDGEPSRSPCLAPCEETAERRWRTPSLTSPLSCVSLRQAPSHTRQKRQSHLSLCHVCCNCCKGNKGCGFCCRFWGIPTVAAKILIYSALISLLPTLIPRNDLFLASSFQF